MSTTIHMQKLRPSACIQGTEGHRIKDEPARGIGDDGWIVRTSVGKKTEYLCANIFSQQAYHFRLWIAGIAFQTDTEKTAKNF